MWRAPRFAMSAPRLRWIAQGARRLARSPRISVLSAHAPGRRAGARGRCRRASLRPISGRGFHVGHHRAPLLGVDGIVGKTPYLISQLRAPASPAAGFDERGAHRLGLVATLSHQACQRPLGRIIKTRAYDSGSHGRNVARYVLHRLVGPTASGLVRALCRTRTGDPFLTMEARRRNRRVGAGIEALLLQAFSHDSLALALAPVDASGLVLDAPWTRQVLRYPPPPMPTHELQSASPCASP